MPLRRGPTPIVLDANLALYALNPSAPEQECVLGLFDRWRDEGRVLIAPSLWRLEVTSGLRKLAAAGILTSAEAQTLLDLFLSWDVEVDTDDPELLREAYLWAERIGDRVIYDSLYLALAERLGAEFWTADKRLVNSARQVGADFVRFLGELRGE